MATKEKKPKAPKKEKVLRVLGRKPTLAPFVDGTFPIYGSYKGKEITARVLSTGVIVMDEKEYATPSAAARIFIRSSGAKKEAQIDGWKFWSYTKDDKRVTLDTLRGKKSPLKENATA